MPAPVSRAEFLEPRLLLCGVAPDGGGGEHTGDSVLTLDYHVPARLTPGLDHFVDGGEVTDEPDDGLGRPDGLVAINLALQDVYMADADGNRVDTPAVGSYAYMVARYTTSGISSSEPPRWRVCSNSTKNSGRP